MKRWVVPLYSNGALASLLCASGWVFLGWKRGRKRPQPASSVSVMREGRQPLLAEAPEAAVEGVTTEASP